MDTCTKTQVETLCIFKHMSPGHLLHLAKVSGLDASHYSNHYKRAAGMTVKMHGGEGLTLEARKEVDKAFSHTY